MGCGGKLVSNGAFVYPSDLMKTIQYVVFSLCFLGCGNDSPAPPANPVESDTQVTEDTGSRADSEPPLSDSGAPDTTTVEDSAVDTARRDTEEPEDTSPSPPDTVEADSAGADGRVDDDAGPAPCPTEFMALGVSATVTPECSWGLDTEGLLGPDEYAVATDMEAGCLSSESIAVPAPGVALTLEWLERRPTDMYGTHLVSVDGSTVFSVFPGASQPIQYRHAYVPAPSADTFALTICVEGATLSDRWEIDDLQVTVGAPPELGSADSQSVLTVTAVAGEPKVVTLPVLDSDVQLEPFVAFPKYEVKNGPEWAFIIQESTAWDPVGEIFTNFLHLNPPADVSGEFVFQVVVTDFQGLHDLRSFVVSIP
jgi:hypothetical protein